MGQNLFHRKDTNKAIAFKRSRHTRPFDNMTLGFLDPYCYRAQHLALPVCPGQVEFEEGKVKSGSHLPKWASVMSLPKGYSFLIKCLS